MKTLHLFAQRPEVIPANIAWYLADLGEARGKQELFTLQSPQKLHALREQALVESAVSGWHEGKHDPWPYIGYVLYVLRDAYKELEQRVGEHPQSK